MNIAQLKEDVANGVMIGRETWKQLIEYAALQEELLKQWNERTEWIQDLQNKTKLNFLGMHRADAIRTLFKLPGNIGYAFDPAFVALDIDRAGIGQPSMPSPAVESLAQSIYTAWPEAEAHPWQPGGNSHKQDEARTQARKLLADKAPPAVECGDTACPRCTTGEPGFCINPDPASAPAVGHENMQLQDGFPLIPDALGYRLAAFKAECAPAPTDDAHIKLPVWNNPASAIANLQRLEYKYDHDSQCGGMRQDDKGSFVRYVAVCTAFGVDPD